jgi:hypothetical protein
MAGELNSAGRLSPVDNVAIQMLRAMALLLGLVGLFLDLTILEVAVGAVVGTLGVGFALLCPRDRYRMVVLSLSLFAMALGGVILLLSRFA